MFQNFERLYTSVDSIYKSIQKIKKCEMNALGLSGKHVMPFYFLLSYPDGLTAAELCSKCNADKAGISRALAEMEAKGYVSFEDSGERRRYRSRVALTEEGKKQAESMRRLILRATLEGGQTITDAERVIFYHVLGIISENLENICAEL